MDQFEINWTLLALDDMNNIAEYHNNISAKYAANFVQEVFDRVELLKSFPRMGRIVPEVSLEQIRELIVGKYRVIYKLKSEGFIDIIVIHPSARPLSGSIMFD